jgi:hypothetical protein
VESFKQKAEVLWNYEKNIVEEWSIFDDEVITEDILETIEGGLVDLSDEILVSSIPTMKNQIISEYANNRISWNNFKNYITTNWGFVEKDLTIRAAFQRKYYWNSLVSLYTSKLLEDYYYSGLKNI